MRYQMKQKLFSFGHDYTIRDEDGRDVFRVDGKVLTLGDKLSFQDMAGRELLFIRQRLLSWGKTYEILHAGSVIATVRQHLFTFLRCRFSVDVPGPDDLEATGSLFDHEYTFTRDGKPVAHVSKRWFSLAGTYGVDIRDGEDGVLILASTVVIDRACHRDDGE